MKEAMQFKFFVLPDLLRASVGGSPGFFGILIAILPVSGPQLTVSAFMAPCTAA
jgi:hypothetical protein